MFTNINKLINLKLTTWVVEYVSFPNLIMPILLFLLQYTGIYNSLAYFYIL